MTLALMTQTGALKAVQALSSCQVSLSADINGFIMHFETGKGRGGGGGGGSWNHAHLACCSPASIQRPKIEIVLSGQAQPSAIEADCWAFKGFFIRSTCVC